MSRKRLIGWFIFKKFADVFMSVLSGMGGFFVADMAEMPGWVGMALAILIILYMDLEYIQRKDRGRYLEDYLPSRD